MVGSVLAGIGIAMVYPALLTSVNDAAHPSWRASSVGVYRFWRKIGYAVGALMAGVIASFLGLAWAVHATGLLIFSSGLVVLWKMKETLQLITTDKTENPEKRISDIGSLSFRNRRKKVLWKIY